MCTGERGPPCRLHTATWPSCSGEWHRSSHRGDPARTHGSGAVDLWFPRRNGRDSICSSPCWPPSNVSRPEGPAGSSPARQGGEMGTTLYPSEVRRTGTSTVDEAHSCRPIGPPRVLAGKRNRVHPVCPALTDGAITWRRFAARPGPQTLHGSRPGGRVRSLLAASLLRKRSWSGSHLRRSPVRAAI